MAKLTELASQRLGRRRRKLEVAQAAVAHSESVERLMAQINRIGWPTFIDRLEAQRSTSPAIDAICVKLERAMARVHDEMGSTPAAGVGTP